ncbi:MAG: acetylornithine/N-succinyldiaminopimelate aminotransferase [Thermoanaerobaculia bacterium]|jgi:adenosylmethionine-8-amino-7-oxononanoate aminotransferase|nr:acetylornithine/N-succinyldiaminopimelate aminotransferase [Thermoanaerobaculia bacterium]
MNLRQLDRKYLGRESEAEDIQVARTKGAFVYDARGKRYIDFLSGWCVGNFGWDNTAITKPSSRRRPDYVYPEYLYRPWVELAQLLAQITPGKLEKTYRATGGSEAVDIALQIAMASTGRRKFVSIEGSYHGNTIGTVSVASREAREPYPNLLSNCMTISPPLGDRAAARLETLLTKRDVAALIMEPISCNLAVLIPEDAFMKRAQELCRRYGTLFIADEVACGFGRTGKLFASEYFDLEPDILCMGKAISGGFAPLGATIITRKVAKSIEGAVGFYSTYGWHPSTVDVALRNIRWLIRNQSRILHDAGEISAYFDRRLAAMTFDDLKDIRIRGMSIAVEAGDGEDYVSAISDRCRKNGLLVTTSGNAITMFPPLTLDRRTAKTGLDILERSLR